VSDPRRLLEGDADEFESELLRSVQVDSVSDGSRRRILTTLGIAGAVVTTSGAAASSLVASKAGLFKGATAVVAKWIAVSTVVALVPAGVYVARSQLRAREIARSSQEAAVVEPKAPANTSNEALAAPTLEIPEKVVTPREPKAAPPPNPSLSDEVAALQVARSALAGHDASGALAALDRYKSRFPAGRLAPEATVLRIEALVERGDRAQASALADRFEASNPKSPYADRIRSILSRSKGQAKDPGAR
jgi:TolA-binding protein